jgi:hypothetical protein
MDADEREQYWLDVEIPYTPLYAYEEMLAPLFDRPNSPDTVTAYCERLVGYLTDKQVIGAEKLTDDVRMLQAARFERKISAADRGAPPRIFVSHAQKDREGRGGSPRRWSTRATTSKSLSGTGCRETTSPTASTGRSAPPIFFWS